MKVLLINGSPKDNGCTYTALSVAEKILKEEGIETQIYHIGKKPVYGCIACKACVETQACIFKDDSANEIIGLLKKADGLIVGSPVHFAGACGTLCALLDRVFYQRSHLYSYKPAAALVCCRREGGGSAFDRLNKYFTYAQMPVVTSHYWNVIHGMTPEDVLKDEEGLQIIRALARNMAYQLKGMALSASSNPAPAQEARVRTNFIR